MKNGIVQAPAIPSITFQRQFNIGHLLCSLRLNSLSKKNFNHSACKRYSLTLTNGKHLSRLEAVLNDKIDRKRKFEMFRTKWEKNFETFPTKFRKKQNKK